MISFHNPPAPSFTAPNAPVILAQMSEPNLAQSYPRIALATLPICVFTHSVDDPSASWKPFHHLGESVTMVFAICAPIVFTPAVAHASVAVIAFWNPTHHLGPSL